jgi:hypothetical protein
VRAAIGQPVAVSPNDQGFDESEADPHAGALAWGMRRQMQQLRRDDPARHIRSRRRWRIACAVLVIALAVGAVVGIVAILTG